MNLNRFPRYKQNLGFKTMPPAGDGAKELRVYSYDTHVATQHGDRLVELRYYRPITKRGAWRWSWSTMRTTTTSWTT